MSSDKLPTDDANTCEKETTSGVLSGMLQRNDAWDKDRDATGDNEIKLDRNKDNLLPPALARLTYKDIFRFGIEKEVLVDPFANVPGDRKVGRPRFDAEAASKNAAPIDMAVQVVVTEKSGRFKYNANGSIKPLYHKTSYKLKEDLSVEQLRRLARNMGFKGITAASKDYIRRALAKRSLEYERCLDDNPSWKLRRFEDYALDLGREEEFSASEEDDKSVEEDREYEQRTTRKRTRGDPFDAASFQEEDAWDKSTEVDCDIVPSRSSIDCDTVGDAAVKRLLSNSGLGKECEGDSTYYKMVLVGAFTNGDMRKQRLLQVAEISNTLMRQACDLEDLGLAPEIVQRLRHHADHAMRKVLLMPTAPSFEGYSEVPNNNIGL